MKAKAGCAVWILVFFFKVLYFAGITPTKAPLTQTLRESDDNLNLIPVSSLSLPLVLRIYSPCKASSLRTFLTAGRRQGRAEAWLDGERCRRWLGLLEPPKLLHERDGEGFKLHFQDT